MITTNVKVLLLNKMTILRGKNMNIKDIRVGEKFVCNNNTYIQNNQQQFAVQGYVRSGVHAY